MKLSGFIRLIRPHQWLKNLMVFFPPFLSGALFQIAGIVDLVMPFAAFCSASSAVYVLNDILDAEHDAHHPRKKSRPLPAGTVSKFQAAFLACCLFVVTALLSSQVSSHFLAFVLAYVVVSLFYSIKFRDWPVVDIFTVATGFILRLYAGGEAFGVIISDWLFLTVFLLAVFLSIGKRYSEQNQLKTVAIAHRRVLEDYPADFLLSAMTFSGAAVLITYSIYVISVPHLVFTVPLCMFGLFRYMMRVQSGESGDPTESLVKDMPLLITGALWLLMVGGSIYL